MPSCAFIDSVRFATLTDLSNKLLYGLFKFKNEQPG